MPSLAPQLSATAAKLILPAGLQSRSELVGSINGVAGAEIMLQELLRIRAELGGPEKARAEQEATVREFHEAPITYNGYGIARQPPSMSVYIIA
ncbi:MAG: hypothetical protein OJJ21_23085 [Ferrovibrio sp.]|uniref:hypothetical protein n=1 Tax=Ferrovibrio sp. TaxID=1917215 RepID=UPI0026361796|nr:hypothetical protein [Ferrovibrio sp.]MCW0236500.1 hypothetical protein [Ferrovibrio sp.]